jgi:hypothetical protein
MEKEAIDFIRGYGISDLQYFKGSPNNSIMIYRLSENKVDFESVYIQQSSLNVI